MKDVYSFESDVIAGLVKTGEIEKAIQLTEAELLKTPKNDFHAIIGRDLLSLTNDVDQFLSQVYQKSLEEINDVQSIHCEMNGFTINPDLWFIAGMSFSFCNDLTDTDWLADYEYFYEMVMVIVGYEDLQKTYEDYIEKQVWTHETSALLCEIIISLRLLELFKKTYELFKDKSDWAKIPVFVNSHDSELIYQTK